MAGALSLPVAGLGDTASALLFGLIGILAYVGVLWIALAFYVVRDARRRSTSRVFVAFAGFLGFLPPFLGALIYLVVRPPRTIDEERTQRLEEQALLDPTGDLEPPRPCPSCGREIDGDFVMCPYCRTQFARRCHACQRTLRLGWQVCPYCAEEVGVRAVTRSTRAVPS